MTQFLLNQRAVALDNLDPDLTVLDWLRLDQRRTGTKEGCATGDCGACTIVLGSLEAGELRYRSANACLLRVAQLAGKQLLTVEDLAEDGALHPLQKALSCGHASQCGFCTPGITMSAFALCHSGESARRETLMDHLGGNLCRCTGYRPIVDAVEPLLGQGVQDGHAARAPETAARLAAMQPQAAQAGPVLMPDSAAALADCLLRYPDAGLLAGGTDLTLDAARAGRRHRHIVALQNVDELRQLRRDGDRLEIGAAVTLTDLQHVLREFIPPFSEMLSRFASRQVRNIGTLGGNLASASPVGDCAPALLALDARLRLRRGEALREIALAEFYTGYRQTRLQPGEFISHILLDEVSRAPNLRLWKVSKRRDDDISTVFAGLNICHENGIIRRARVAFGGMAATPARARRCESALVGKPLKEATFAAAGEALEADFSPLSDVRASAGYRLQVAKNLLRRYGLLLAGCAQLEVTDYGR